MPVSRSEGSKRGALLFGPEKLKKRVKRERERKREAKRRPFEGTSRHKKRRSSVLPRRFFEWSYPSSRSRTCRTSSQPVCTNSHFSFSVLTIDSNCSKEVSIVVGRSATRCICTDSSVLEDVPAVKTSNGSIQRQTRRWVSLFCHLPAKE